MLTEVTLHIYTIYAAPNNSCTWIAMLSVLESMAAEIAEVSLFGTPYVWPKTAFRLHHRLASLQFVHGTSHKTLLFSSIE
jgi:hypothetical protein